MMDQADIAAFDASVEGVLANEWGEACSPDGRNLMAVWSRAIKEGWLELDDDVDALVRVARGCGRHGLPLPIAEASVVRRLRPALDSDIAAGRVRPAIRTTTTPPLVDGGGTATHALRLDDRVGLAEITSSRPQDGVAAPAWHAIELGAEAVLDVDVAERERALSVVRLCWTARALGAATRSLELATEHACNRHQFGRAIGSFGAVQQRIAALTIDARAAELLVASAAEALAEGTEDAALAVELAVEHVHRAAQEIQFGAQHTLGAIGYFDESPAPWLFRRVQADLAQLTATSTKGAADHLLDGTGSLPPIPEPDDVATLRARIRQLFVDEGVLGRTQQSHVDDPRAVSVIADAGLLGLTLPTDVGGQSLGARHQAALIEEMGYGRVSAYVSLNSVLFLGRAIDDHGTPEQRRQFLPMMREGQLRFCLGYSEPETGSDLASLRTQATRSDDGDWVVNGQKTWTTRAHRSDWMWLAARTNPDASLRHRGISIFMLPMDSPGIEIQEHRSQGGEISCTVFLDDVRISDSLRIGGIDEGWQVINTALAGERTSMAAVTASMHRQLDDLLDHLRAGELPPRGTQERATISVLAARLQGARLLVRDAVDAINRGEGTRLEAPMAAVAGGELAVDFGVGVMRLLGPRGLLGARADSPIGHGGISQALLMASKSVIGGGTNDVLRGVVARSLGLPR